ncbi:MAG: hypothetical protein HSCHL_0386 [Hydrogenibacillus schlegelii]|uniref:Uncharacterized protein n=1 Tax=Hydrogenibacillus schlegelii TaxID=1484 RepID=A0A2T5GE54_HYDSH|nr:MAG: hypothetical protein HSCHL_0386 [Hydrogenibacillus schlegelii]
MAARATIKDREGSESVAKERDRRAKGRPRGWMCPGPPGLFFARRDPV